MPWTGLKRSMKFRGGKGKRGREKQRGEVARDEAVRERVRKDSEKTALVPEISLHDKRQKFQGKGGKGRGKS